MMAAQADFSVPRRSIGDPEIAAKAAAGMVRALHRTIAPESWVLTVSQVNAWLRHATPGAKLLYARGPDLLRGDTTRHLGTLASAGVVTMIHPRSKDQPGFDHFAIKQVSPARPPHQRRETPIDDPAMSAIFLRLKAAARLGQRCPTDATLAKAVGLTIPQVHWRMRKLVQLQLIRTRIERTPSEPNYRVVTIVATGLETALPLVRL